MKYHKLQKITLEIPPYNNTRTEAQVERVQVDQQGHTTLNISYHYEGTEYYLLIPNSQLQSIHPA